MIRAIRCQEYLRDKLYGVINKNTPNRIMGFAIIGWYNVQQQFLQNFIIFLPLYGILLWRHYTSEKVDPDVVYFVRVLQKFATSFFTLMYRISLFELQLVSIERLERYENLEPENGYSGIEIERKLFKELNSSKLRKAKMYVKRSLEFKK